jgi:hypothetical protein
MEQRMFKKAALVTSCEPCAQDGAAKAGGGGVEVQEVSVVGAVAFVFMASTMLLLLFFFLNRVFAIVLVCTAEQIFNFCKVRTRSISPVWWLWWCFLVYLFFQVGWLIVSTLCSRLLVAVGAARFGTCASVNVRGLHKQRGHVMQWPRLAGVA